jgi:hypothetical protein
MCCLCLSCSTPQISAISPFEYYIDFVRVRNILKVHSLWVARNVCPTVGYLHQRGLQLQLSPGKRWQHSLHSLPQTLRHWRPKRCKHSPSEVTWSRTPLTTTFLRLKSYDWWSVAFITIIGPCAETREEERSIEPKGIKRIIVNIVEWGWELVVQKVNSKSYRKMLKERSPRVRKR